MGIVVVSIGGVLLWCVGMILFAIVKAAVIAGLREYELEKASSE